MMRHRRRTSTKKKKKGRNKEEKDEKPKCNHGAPELNDHQHDIIFSKILDEASNEIKITAEIMLEIAEGDSDAIVQTLLCIATTRLLANETKLDSEQNAWACARHLLDAATDISVCLSFERGFRTGEDQKSVRRAINRHEMFWASKKEVVLYLDRKIPCNCLAKLKQQVLDNPQAYPEQFQCQACEKVDGDMKVCPNCNFTFYCSEGCQLAHWPQHKKLCKMYSCETTWIKTFKTHWDEFLKSEEEGAFTKMEEMD